MCYLNGSFWYQPSPLSRRYRIDQNCMNETQASRAHTWRTLRLIHTPDISSYKLALVWKGKKQANNKSVKRVVLLIRPVPFAQWVANTSKNMKTTMLIIFMHGFTLNKPFVIQEPRDICNYFSFHWPQLKEKCFITNLTMHLISVDVVSFLSFHSYWRKECLLEAERKWKMWQQRLCLGDITERGTVWCSVAAVQHGRLLVISTSFNITVLSMWMMLWMPLICHNNIIIILQIWQTYKIVLWCI